MANITKLIITATTTNGTKKLTYSHADPDVPTNDVKALTTALVANGDVFDPAITAIQGAMLQTTTETDIDLGN